MQETAVPNEFLKCWVGCYRKEKSGHMTKFTKTVYFQDVHELLEVIHCVTRQQIGIF